MATTSVIRQVPPKDIRADIRAFILNAGKPNEDPVDVIRKALSLLKSLPASRDAVFEYLSNVFDVSAFNYMLELENRGKQPKLSTPPITNAILDEINRDLCQFLSSQCLPWSIFVSKWAYFCLGKISAKYASRGRAPVNGTLNDSLQQWLMCRATKILLDLAVHALTVLDGKDEEGPCINALLGIITAPKTDIQSVIQHASSPKRAGLEEVYCTFFNVKQIKLKSITGILIHLSSSHLEEVENAIHDIIQQSLDSNDDTSIKEKQGTVPYLLSLSSSTPMIFDCFVKVVQQIINPSIFDKLIATEVHWYNFGHNKESYMELIARLIINVQKEADKIFFLLLETSTYYNVCGSIAQEIIDRVIRQLEITVRGSGSKVSFLEHFGKNIENKLPLLIHDRASFVSIAKTMFSFIGEQQQPLVISKCISYILLHAEEKKYLISIIDFCQTATTDVLTQAIKFSLVQTEPFERHRFWSNLQTLLRDVNIETVLSEAIYSNISLITDCFFVEKDLKYAHMMAEILRKPLINSKIQPSIKLCRLVIQAILYYFFWSLRNSEGMEKLIAVRRVSTILQKLSQQAPHAKVFIFRELLETILFRQPSVLFGGLDKSDSPLVEPLISLQNENIKQGHTALMGQRHSSVFHAGVIGTANKTQRRSHLVSDEDVVNNTCQLLMVLKSCCVSDNNQEELDAVISVALLLVELISPDVMYNGLPWPEEDFCKVTVERDLSIRRILDQNPVVWSLLGFIAQHRPALCYCSVILRAMIATLLGQWFAASQQGHGPGHSKELISTTSKILQIMALGQLLPPPLNALSDVIPHMLPVHVVGVLRECVWNYMRDHVPSPALFSRDPDGNMWRDTASSRPPKQYTETLRVLMLLNLPKLGHLYHTLFVQGFVEESENRDKLASLKSLMKELQDMKTKKST